MSLLLETIKCRDGQLDNLSFHQKRFSRSISEYFRTDKEISLREVIHIPPACRTGLFRCRVLYSTKIQKIEFHPHHYRKIRSLKLIEASAIEYPYKFADREKLNALFSRRADGDDILIVKNGCITDSFTANVVFFDGCRWWTPDTPLLPGTRREQLIEEGKISVCRISISDLVRYTKAGLINAMQGLEEMPVVQMKHIFR